MVYDFDDVKRNPYKTLINPPMKMSYKLNKIRIIILNLIALISHVPYRKFGFSNLNTTLKKHPIKILDMPLKDFIT